MDGKKFLLGIHFSLAGRCRGGPGSWRGHAALTGLRTHADTPHSGTVCVATEPAAAFLIGVKDWNLTEMLHFRGLSAEKKPIIL